jgi:hypothetical protein
MTGARGTRGAAEGARRVAGMLLKPLP